MILRCDAGTQVESNLTCDDSTKHPMITNNHGTKLNVVLPKREKKKCRIK
jgi:hypothetical protein